MEQDRLARTMRMNRTQFRRRTGVYPETFAEMEAVLAEREAQKKKSGRPAALSVAEQLPSRTWAMTGAFMRPPCTARWNGSKPP